MSQQQPQLPPGWVCTRDPQGRVFYFNTATRESSWTPPQMPQRPQQQQQQQFASSQFAPQQPPQPQQQFASQFAPQQPQRPAARAVLPAGWEEAFDPRSGRVFYIDHAHKTTSWTPPPPPPQSASAASSQQPQYFYAAPGMQQQQQRPYQQYPPQQYPPQQSQQQHPYQQYPPQQSQPPMPAAYTYAPQPAPAPAPAAAAAMPMPMQVPMQGPVSSVPEAPMLCTSTPSWTAPLASDATACPRCGQAYTMFKRKHTCKCCGRDFCDACTQKKSVIPVVSPQATRVCESCHAHLSRSDRRCVCRLVPYLADPKDEVRGEALGEMNTLVVSGSVAPAEVAGTGCLLELAALLSSPSRARVSQAASLIAFVLRHPPAAEQAAEPGVCKALATALVAHGSDADSAEAAAPITAALAAVAATEKGRATMLAPITELLRGVSAALSSASPEVAANSARILELLAADKSGKPFGETDAESATVFALVPLVRSVDAPSSPAARTASLAALDRLCDREHGCMSLAQSDEGVAALVDLAGTPGSSEVDSLRSMSIVFKLASRETCAGALQGHTAKLVSAALAASPTAAQAAETLAVLSQADSTQRPVNKELLLDHAASLARMLSIPAPNFRTATMAILASVMSTHAEIAGGVFRESGVAAALGGIVRERGPASAAALSVFAQCGGASDDAGNSGVAEVCTELLTRGDPAVAAAFPVLAALPSVAARLAAIPQLVPTLAQLLGRGTTDPAIAAPLCAGIAALCGTVKAFATAAFAPGSPLLPLSALLICSSNTELQMQALRMAGAVAAADPRAAETLAMAPPGFASALCGLLRPSATASATVLSATLSTAGAMIAASATFRAELLRNGGVASIIAVTASSNETARERAAAALVPICAAGEEERAAVRAARGIPALAELTFSAPHIVKAHASAALSFFALGAMAPQDCSEMQSLGIPLALAGAVAPGAGNIDALRETAAHALGNIFMHSEEARRSAFEAAVLPASIDMLKTGSDSLRQQAIWLLRGLLYLPAAAEEFAHTGIDVLQSLAADASASQATKDAAISLSTLLAGSSAAAMESFAANAGLGAIVAIVASPASPPEAKIHAAEHIGRAASVPEWLEAILAAKGVEALAAVAASDGPVHAPALGALAALCGASSDARRALLGFPGGLDSLLRATLGSKEESLHGLAGLLAIAADKLAVPAMVASPAVKRLAALVVSKSASPDVVTAAVAVLLALASHGAESSRPVAEALEASHENLASLLATLPAPETLKLLAAVAPASGSVRSAIFSHEAALRKIFEACMPSSPAQEAALALIGTLSAADPAAFALASKERAVDVAPLAAAVAASAESLLPALASVCRASKGAAAAAGSSAELTSALPALVEKSPEPTLSLVAELACSEAFRKSVLEGADKWCDLLADNNTASSVRAIARLAAGGYLRAKMSEHEKLLTMLASASVSASTSQQEDAIRALWSLGSLGDLAALFGATIAREEVPPTTKSVAAMAISSSLGGRDSIAAFFSEDTARAAALCVAFLAGPSFPLLQLLIALAQASEELRLGVLAGLLKPEALSAAEASFQHMAKEIGFLADLIGSP